MQSNINVIKKAIKGNKRAYYSLIKEYTPYLYKIAFLHTKYEEDAKSIFEDTVYNSFKNIHKLKYPDKFKIWITRILINEIDYFLEYTGMVESEVEIKPNTNKIDLYKAIDILESKIKSVIILRYYCNFKVEEIGEILDLSQNTVNIYTKRGFKEMKELLKEEHVC